MPGGSGECRAPLATAVGVLAGLAFLGWLSLELTGYRAVYPEVAPLAAVVVVAALYASVRAVGELGGPGPFFCGGRAVLHSLLGHGRAEPPEEIVERGPYSAARHPVYSATIAAYAALTAVAPGLVVGLALAAVWVAAAALAEERVLRRNPRYLDYARRVPMIAPVRVVAWALGEMLRGPRR